MSAVPACRLLRERGELARRARTAARHLADGALGPRQINLVTPSHVVPRIVSALLPAVEGGLDIPVVSSTGKRPDEVQPHRPRCQ